MTTSADARAAGSLRRRPVLLIGILLIGAAAAAIAGWFLLRSPASPLPPPVPPNPTDPKVTASVEKIRERVLKEPHSARAWSSLGQAFLANDMEAESRVCFAEAERLDPDNPRWPYYQARVLLNQGDLDAALPYLQRAVQRGALAAPDNPAPQLRLAETLLTLGRLDEAEEHFRQVVEQHPDDARASYGLGLAASARQDWQASRRYLLRCLGNPTAQQKASVQLAAVCQRLGDSAEAEKFRQQAHRLSADRDWVDPFVTEYLSWAMTKRNRYRHADSLEAAGRLTEASAVLRPLVEEYPDDYLPHLTLGKILGRLHENTAAETQLREALRLAPDKIHGRHYLSLVLFDEAEQCARAGDRARAERLYEEAADNARQVLDVKSDYGLAHMALGLSLKRLGRRDEARKALRQAVRCNPEYAELHFYLGEMLAEDGREEEARERLKQALQMAPPNAPWKPSAQRRLTTESQRTQRKNTEQKKEN
jgi:tetratricopeptide (TPR) repeat protein